MENIEKYYSRICENVCQLYSRRGYDSPETPGEVESFSVQPLATCFAEKANDANVVEAAAYAATNNCSQVIIVTEEPPTVKQRCGFKNGVSYRCFHYQELLVDIFQHELVPEQLLLSDKEAEQIKRRYRVRDDQLPKMNIFDPVAMRLGAERGQIILVKRNQDEVEYRCVL